MKSQRRLRLRQVGRHHGDPRPWMWHHRVWNQRARALEMNCIPKHSKDELPQQYNQMNYVTGACEWHSRLVLNDRGRVETVILSDLIPPLPPMPFGDAG